MQPKLTQQQALDLVNGVVGQRIVSDLDGYTDVYGAQCIALITWYVTNLGYPSIGYNNAVDIWNKNPLNLPKFSSPQAGDIHFMNITFQGQSFGHVGVVVAVDGNNITSVDQNWLNPSLTTGSPAAKVTHPINQITGFLRPQFKQEVEVMDKNDLIGAYLAVLHRDYSKGQVTDNEINGSVGKKPSDWFAQTVASKEWLHLNDLVIFGDQRLQQIQSLLDKVKQLESSPTTQQIAELQNEANTLVSTISKLQNINT